MLEPEERAFHRCAQTKIAQKKIFKFMMIVTYLFYQMQCAGDDVQRCFFKHSNVGILFRLFLIKVEADLLQTSHCIYFQDSFLTFFVLFCDEDT